MKRFLFFSLVLGLLVAVQASRAQQVVYFDYNNVSNPERVTSKHTDLTVGDFFVNVSTLNFKTTGGYLDSKQISEGNDWNKPNVDEAKRFYVDITVGINKRLTIKGVSFESYRTAAGPQKFDLYIDGVGLQSEDLPEGTQQSLNYSLSVVKEGTFRVELRGWNASGSGTWRIDEFKITGTISDIPDTTPPVLQAANTSGRKQVTLTFNEPLDNTAARTVANYSVGGTNPQSVDFTDDTKMEVELTFANDFQDGVENTISVENLKDLKDNAISPAVSSTFTYTKLKYEELTVVDAAKLSVKFSDAPDLTSATTPSTYVVDNSVGSPASVTKDDTNERLYHLTFSSPLPQDILLGLNINVEDVHNETESFSDNFYYYEIDRGEVVINEIMADLNPYPADLPTEKYIELKNNLPYDISLSGWKLKIGTTEKDFPSETFPANSYLILTGADNVYTFSSYGKTIAVDASALSSSGKEVQLLRPDGKVVSLARYDKSTYQDDNKSEGGWALERIDENNACAGEANWKASTDYKGGTPGRQNSVAAAINDNSAPALQQFELVSSKAIRLVYNERLKSDELFAANFSVSGGVGQPSSLTVSDDEKTIDLVFSTQFPMNVAVDLSGAGISDYCGNSDNLLRPFTYEQIRVEQVEVKSANQLRVVFNEAVDPASAAGSDFVLDGSVGAANYVFVDPNDAKVVHVEFSNSMVDGQFYELVVDVVTDVNGNANVVAANGFYYNPPAVELNSIQVLGKQNVVLYYSGKLNASALATGNFILEGNSIASVAFYNGDETKVELQFSSAFQDGIEQTIQISALKTKENEDIASSSISFTWNELLLENTELLDANTIRIELSQLPNTTDLLSVNSYTLDNSIGRPDRVLQDAENSKVVKLEYDTELLANQLLTLTVNLRDSYGENFSGSSSVYHQKLDRTSVVINELMVDINPAPSELPAYKYIELYNTTDNSVDLTAWTLRVGDSHSVLPITGIPAKSYLILCSANAESVFSGYGTAQTLSVVDELSASGAELRLEDRFGRLISGVSYSNQSYGNEDKNNGGWALERVVADLECLGDDNWKASENYRGGTPGNVNSVAGSVTFDAELQIQELNVLNAREIKISFNRILNADLLTPASFSVDQGVGVPTSVDLAENGRDLTLGFSTNFTPAVTSQLSLIVEDVCGSSLNTQQSFEYSPISLFAVEQKSDNQLRLQFSEAVDVATVLKENFVLDQSIGQPFEVLSDPLDASVVHLQFTTNFVEGTAYILSIENIQDVFGNALGSTTWNFTVQSTPAAFESLTIKTSKSLILKFTAKLDATSALNQANYTVEGNTVKAVEFTNAEQNELLLTFESDFPDTEKQVLATIGLKSFGAQEVAVADQEFTYSKLYISNKEIVSSTQLKLNFSTSPEETSLTSVASYELVLDGKQPQTVEKLNETTVQITFADAFLGNTDLELKVSLTNRYGEQIEETISFRFYPSTLGDIAINEIMADVNPQPAELPAAKYIELYNNTDREIDLENWILKIGESSTKLTAQKLPSKQYLLITTEEFADLLSVYGISMGGLNASSLASSGATIELLNQYSERIAFTEYSNAMYGDENKDNGGWSLERIDPSLDCLGASNWKASENYFGGTPGKQNSIYKDLATTTGFDLESTEVVSSRELLLKFNRHIDTETLVKDNFKIDQGVGTSAQLMPEGDKLRVLFPVDFPDADMTLSFSLSDLCGNSLNSTATFAYQGITLNKLEIKSDTQLQLEFNEAVDAATLQVSAFSLDQEIGNPVSVLQNPQNRAIVYLDFGSPFKDGAQHTLSMTGVTDVNGNALKTTQTSFAFQKANSEFLSLDILSNKRVRLSFSEKMDATAALDKANFAIVENPTISAAFETDEQKSLILEFLEAFPDGEKVELAVSNQKSFGQIAIEDFKTSFTYYVLAFEEAVVLSSSSLSVKLNRLPEEASIAVLENWTMAGKHPERIEQNATVFSLYFAENFVSNTDMDFNFTIKDEYGVDFTATTKLRYNAFERGTVVFNELMFDISPAPRALPEAKYIELYNTSEELVILTDWSLQLGASTVKFPEAVMPPKSHLILCAEAQEAVFASFGTSLGIVSESRLSSTGTDLVLFDKWGNVIDELSYDSNLYQDEEKASGGSAIERRDPANLCAASANWRASLDNRGGTPNAQNSVLETIVDEQAPELVSVTSVSAKELLLHFNEVLNAELASSTDSYWPEGNLQGLSSVEIEDGGKTVRLRFSERFPEGEELKIIIDPCADWCGNSSATEAVFTYSRLHITNFEVWEPSQVKVEFSEAVDPESCVGENFEIVPDLGVPSSVSVDPVQPNKVYLNYASPFEDGVQYKVQVKNVTDKFEEAMKGEELPFMIHTVAEGEVVINEVLTYPNSGGVRFIELINRSVYPINLKQLQIVKKENGEIVDRYPLMDSDRMLKTDSFVVLTEDPEILKEQYTTLDENVFIKMKELPAYDKKTDKVSLYTSQDVLIDELDYDSDMHLSLLSDYARGISLERVNAHRPTQERSNWQSAAANAGYATPGVENSQYRSKSEGSGNFKTDREIFSPDGDGEDDFMLINYKTPAEDAVANVTIYDANGTLINRIVRNELMAAEGAFKWDGTDTNGNKAPIGIYVIFIEWFSPNGEVHKEKLTCVVGGRLK